MLAETGFTVGREVLKVVVKTWLGLRKGETERQSQLIDLLAVSIRDVGLRRRIGLRFEDMAAQVSDRIAPFYEVEFRGLPEYEKRAALDAVVDTLSTADLSDAALFDAALSAPELARIARSKLAVERQEEFARRATGRGRKGRGLDGATFGLSTDAYELYLRVLDDTCLAMVKLLQQLPPFVPRATTELLKQVIDVGDRLDEVLSLLPRTSLDAPRGTAHDWEFHQAYVTHVSDKLDDLELFGMGSRGYRPRTRVSVAYLSLKVLDETPTGPTSTSGRDREDRRSVEATLARSPRTLVRGEAGSGKTTLLQWLAVNAARGSFVGPLHKWNNHVPVLIRLRSYAERDLPMGNRLILDEAAVLEDIVPDAWVRRQLASGRALLLVDGVDELPSKERSRVHAWLRDLTAEFREVPVVVTSRPNAAEATWLADLGFAGVLIEPMSNHDIELFCARWHDSVAQYARDGHAPWLPCPPAELPDYRRSLLRQLDSARHLRALATNPLLCAMLCTLNLGLRARLPLDRMQLYAEALTLLLQRRDDERGVVSPLDLRAKLAVLQYLAWSATLAGRSELARDDALIHVKHALDRMPEQHGSADEVLNHLLERSGVLREPVLGRVDFVHRTFQEYLAAKQAADEHRIDMLVRYSAEDEWRETVIMAAGHATERNRDRLLTGILDQATAAPNHSRLLRLLAAAALDAGRTASPEVTARVTAEVAELFPPKSPEESQVLAIAGDLSLNRLPRDLAGLDIASAVACVNTAGYINGPQALALLRSYAADSRLDVRFALTHNWRYFNPGEYAKVVMSRVAETGEAVVVDAIEYLPHISHLGDAPVLIHVLSGHPVPDLDFTTGVTRLRSLIVRTSRPVDLRPLRAHEDLVTLGVFEAGADRGYEALQTLGRLHSLAVGGLFADAVLSLIGEHPLLIDLRLDGFYRSRTLAGIAAFPHLVELHLPQCEPLTDVTELAALPRLRSLVLGGALLRGGLAALPTDVLGRLDVLELHDAKTVFGLDALRGTSLQGLAITYSKIRDLAPLADLPRLEYLHLAGNHDLDLSPLAGLKNLRDVDLRDGDRTVDLAPLPRGLTVMVSPYQRVVGADGLNVRIG